MTSASDAAADAAGMEYVKEHQARFPDWLLMYSRVDRGLVAFFSGHCPPPGIMVKASHPDDLLRRMAEEAQALWRAQPSGGWPMPAVVMGSGE